MRWQTGVVVCMLLLASACATTPTTNAMYRGLGESGGINNIVETFMPLLLADARVGNSLKDADILHLKEKLAEQFCYLSGGPCTYRGKSMTEIHDGLNITSGQFYALVEDLQIAMQRNGVATSIQNQLLAKLAPMHRDVVTK